MRSYKQFCGVAKALDVVGERWTLLLVRELLPGPRRYSDLLAALSGLTTNLLAARLKRLTAHGLIVRERLPPPAGSHVYRLTDAGRGLEPVVHALGTFGSRYLTLPAEGDRRDFRWFAVSMGRRVRDVDPTPYRVGFRCGPLEMTGHWDGERFRVTDGLDPCDLILEGTVPQLIGALLELGDAQPSAVRGDKALFERLRSALRAPSRDEPGA